MLGNIVFKSVFFSSYPMADYVVFRTGLVAGVALVSKVGCNHEVCLLVLWYTRISLGHVVPVLVPCMDERPIVPYSIFDFKSYMPPPPLGNRLFT